MSSTVVWLGTDHAQPSDVVYIYRINHRASGSAFTISIQPPTSDQTATGSGAFGGRTGAEPGPAPGFGGWNRQADAQAGRLQSRIARRTFAAGAINGATELETMRQTGHRSLVTLRRYIREGQLFRAAAGLGFSPPTCRLRIPLTCLFNVQ